MKKKTRNKKPKKVTKKGGIPGNGKTYNPWGRTYPGSIMPFPELPRTDRE